MISIFIAFILNMLFVDIPARHDVTLSNIISCQHELVACATGNCRPEIVTSSCPIDALRPRELLILQTELQNITKEINDVPGSDRKACVEAFDSDFSKAIKRLDQHWLGRNDHMVTPRSNLHGEDLEAVYRAKLDLLLTGIAMRAMAKKSNKKDFAGPKACPLGTFMPVMLLRAQNLGFAREHNFIDRLKTGDLNEQILYAPYFIFFHADLWQHAQEEAADVFDNLQARGKFPAVSARYLRERVAAHTPLYEDGDLHAGWPHH